MMKEEDRILLFMGWALLMLGIIMILCKLSFETDETAEKIESMENQIYKMTLATAGNAERATETNAVIDQQELTVATAGEATPTEPTDDEIVIELNDEYKTETAEATTQATPAEPIEPATPTEPVLEYAGTYELTAYIATGNPCADGVYPSTNFTAASNDPKLWHKYIHIDGYGDYYIHDTGGMASNVIDLFVGSYDEAIQFGRRSAAVYIKGQ